MKYNFDKIIDRRNTNCIKWDGGEIIKSVGITDRFDDESISLFIADMDFQCPEPVLKAMHKTVDQQIFGYTSHQLSSDYSNAIVNWFHRRHNWNINPEHLVYTPGTVFAVHAAVNAYTNPGDGIIIQRPVYAPFTEAIEKNGRVVRNNELRNNDGYYTMDFDDLEAKASEENTRMLIFCSPHNPVGRIWNKEELRRVIEICDKHDVLILSDEIHSDLIRQNENFLTIADYMNHDRYVICTAINKTFNLAGLHCSNLVIPNKELRETYQNIIGIQSPTPFALNALIAAYNESEDWLEQVKEYIDENFRKLDAFLKEHMPKVKFRIPEGTYIAWLDFSAYGLSNEEVHNRIYNKANVVLEDGKIFGEASSHFQRICLPSPWPLIEKAMMRIKKEFE